MSFVYAFLTIFCGLIAVVLIRYLRVILVSYKQLARENEFMRMTLVSEYGRTEFNRQPLEVPSTKPT